MTPPIQNESFDLSALRSGQILPPGLSQRLGERLGPARMLPTPSKLGVRNSTPSQNQLKAVLPSTPSKLGSMQQQKATLPDFLSDEEMAKFETPDFISDTEMGQYENPSVAAEPQQEEQPGFFQSLARGIVNPILRAGATIGAVGEAALTDRTYDDLKQESFTAPFFGEIKPAQSGLDAAGIGLETAASVFGGGAVKSAAKIGGKQLFKQSGRQVLKDITIPAAKRGAVSGGAFGAGQSLQAENPTVGGVAGRTLIGGALGGATGGILPSVLRPRVATGSALKEAGEKIQTTVIKPNAKDFKDGFDVRNVGKYGVGGSLEDTLTKTTERMNQLGTQLKTIIKSSDKKVNLNSVVSEVKKDLRLDKALTFGDSMSLKRVLKELEQEVKAVTKNGEIDLPTAQLIKRASGAKGAWTYGMIDKDARASEKIYSAFYNKLKIAIEQNSGDSETVKLINKQISELIPIYNAVLRRIPVAERNNILSLTDLISIAASTVDPRALALLGFNKLSKSSRVGDILVKGGRKFLGDKPIPLDRPRP